MIYCKRSFWFFQFHVKWPFCLRLMFDGELDDAVEAVTDDGIDDVVDAFPCVC